MRTFKTEGIVLKRRNAGEADRILTVFTKHHGKLKIKAVGVRRIISRRAPHIELINLSQFTLYKSSHSFMPILTEAQTLEDFSAIKDNLAKVGFAYYICELADAFCPENQENAKVFSLIYDTFLKLSDDLEPKQIISNFEKNLLSYLGFWPKDKLFQDNNYESFIENILERRLRTKRLLQLLH